ncbi:unnamed protein product [Camellia sinensis]
MKVQSNLTVMDAERATVVQLGMEAFSGMREKRLEEATGLEAELWGVYRGLTIILEKGMRDIIVETDSVQVVKLLQEESSPTFQHRALLEDAKFLMQRCKCIIQHILREGNKAADGLANLGANHQDSFVFLNDPPTEATSLLVANILGTSSM